MGSYYNGNVWIDTRDWNTKSLMSISVILDRTRTITTLVAYLVDALLRNFSARKMQWLIVNEQTVVGCPMVCYTDKGLEEEESREDEGMSVYGFQLSVTVRQENCVPVTADSKGRKRCMRLYYKAMKVVLGSCIDVRWHFL